jgi:hypothetical protein
MCIYEHTTNPNLKSLSLLLQGAHPAVSLKLSLSSHHIKFSVDTIIHAISHHQMEWCLHWLTASSPPPPNSSISICCSIWEVWNHAFYMKAFWESVSKHSETPPYKECHLPTLPTIGRHSEVSFISFCGLLYNVIISDHRATRSNRKECAISHGLINVLLKNLSGELTKTTKTSIRTAGALVKIRTKHFLNTSFERYHYTSLFSIRCSRYPEFTTHIYCIHVKHA